MGTITARRRKDGTTGYTAQIRLKRDGKIVHNESETFGRRALATEWLRRRESELDQQRSRGEPVGGKRMTVAEMVAWYEGRERTDQPWGRSKRADLARVKAGSLADRLVHKLTKQDFIAYTEQRRKSGAGPATASNDLIWFRQVFKSAAAVENAQVPLAALDEAAFYLRSERLIGKPKRRDRRMTATEETKILKHLDERRGPIPMGDIARFALLTARRQEEIVRLRWEDLNKSKGIALLRDVKHPTQKIGNHKTFRMPALAWEIIERQQKIKGEPLIFPFESKSVGAAFTRAVRFVGIEDLHFHDLRHEATSRLFERGYNIQEVAQFTLHESWTTLKRYTHLRAEDVPER